MLWGEQWLCLCGWANLALRKKCRNCGLPVSLKVEEQKIGDVMNIVGKAE